MSSERLALGAGVLWDRAVSRVTFPLAEDIGVDDDRFVDLFKPDIKPLAAARPIELLRSQYLRDLSALAAGR